MSDKLTLRETQNTLWEQSLKGSAARDSLPKQAWRDRKGREKAAAGENGDQAGQGVAAECRGKQAQYWKPAASKGRARSKACPVQAIEQRYGLLNLRPVVHSFKGEAADDMPGVKRSAEEATAMQRIQPAAPCQHAEALGASIGALGASSYTPPVMRPSRPVDAGSPMVESPQVRG